ncbi:FAD-binding oxidoreductase [Prescottella sp. R16]|uniref:NAD(P)/FAD-dependent oxidoreductase n=1 Tax=Prescottella sp. R16 TaxID=3064529 RepID=UPI00272E838D|nr:FAD-dependent oxidoreductase [Prescottella sp. R16]
MSRSGTAGSDRVLVIGAGPQGAATARHLAEAGCAVTIVGPEEPQTHVGHEGTWSGHYDQGRIAATDPLFVPTAVGLRAMARYADIEEASGISFTTVHPQLVLFADPETVGSEEVSESGRELDALLGNCRDFGTSGDVLDGGQVSERFPGLRIPAGQIGVCQDDAIIVNPRLLVRAELVLAETAGAKRVVDEVVSLASERDEVVARTASGAEFRADRAVVATGAATNAIGLLPRQMQTRVFGATMVLFEVEPAAVPNFPTLMYISDHFGGGIVIPPVQYPDGRWYIKCASGELMAHPLQTRDDIAAWASSGGTVSEVDYFRGLVPQFLPDVELGAAIVKPCLVGMNVDGNPYVDRVDDRTVVVTEGHRGVMMADELGRLAADLVRTGRWSDALPRELFRVHWH